MLVLIVVTCAVLLGACAASLWIGYRYGKEDERHQWQRLVDIGQLPQPGQAWTAVATEEQPPAEPVKAPDEKPEPAAAVPLGEKASIIMQLGQGRI